jgi:hypothetical protein
MASGDTLLTFTVLANQPPASNYATLDTRNSHPVLDFDPSTDETAVFGDVLPRHYAGNGITVTVVWMATTGTTGNVIWQGSFERDDTGLDLDADSFATAQSVTTAAPGTNGAPAYSAIAFTNAQIDSLAAGEAFRLKITRNASSGSDTMTGSDAELLRVEIKET